MKTGSDARCLTTGLTQSARLRIEAHEDFVFQEGSCAEPRQLVCVCVRKVYRTVYVRICLIHQAKYCIVETYQNALKEGTGS